MTHLGDSDLLSSRLWGLPLALDQAGAYMEKTGCSVADYRQRYQTRRALLLQERGGVLFDHPDSVTTTLSLSFEKVEQRSPVAVEVLRLCAYLSPEAIPEGLLITRMNEWKPVLASAVVDDFQLDEAIAALRSYSLVSRNTDAHTLTIHRLVGVATFFPPKIPAKRGRADCSNVSPLCKEALPGHFLRENGREYRLLCC